jgi:hypothetical protein
MVHPGNSFSIPGGSLCLGGIIAQRREEAKRSECFDFHAPIHHTKIFAGLARTKAIQQQGPHSLSLVPFRLKQFHLHPRGILPPLPETHFSVKARLTFRAEELDIPYAVLPAFFNQDVQDFPTDAQALVIRMHDHVEDKGMQYAVADHPAEPNQAAILINGTTIPTAPDGGHKLLSGNPVGIVPARRLKKLKNFLLRWKFSVQCKPGIHGIQRLSTSEQKCSSG